MTEFPQNLHQPCQNLCPNSELLWLHALTLCRIFQDNHQILCHQFDILLSCWRSNSRGKIVLIYRIGAERGNIGLTMASGQENWVLWRLRSLLSKILGQQVTRSCKRRVEWRLTTRVFDLVATGGKVIVAFGAGMFAKRVEMSCSGLAVSKDKEKNPGTSRGEDFAVFGNRQKCLIEWQEEGKS